MANKLEDDLEAHDIGSGGAQSKCFNWKWCWWNPPQDDLVTEFFNESSLHGLQYIVQPKRHFTERIFWFVSFIIGFVAAGVLIYQVFQRNADTPVIVSFKSKEQSINTIPFPAVTICNVNMFSKKDVLELQRIAALPDHENATEAKQKLKRITTFCSGLRINTYTYRFYSMNAIIFRPWATEANQTTDMMDFLAENTVPCDKIIKLCYFKGSAQTFECVFEFQTVIREYGRCCTFNMLPLPLLYENPNENSSIFDNPAFETKLKEEEEWKNYDISKWSRWNYDKTLLLQPTLKPDKKNKEKQLPRRQIGAGKSFGLTIVLDTELINSSDYHCPAFDSEGLMFSIHSPIEIPQVNDFPSVLEKGKEVFINVRPDVTFADPDIRDLESESRQCYFGKEKKLKLYRPYTRVNCLDDCKNDEITRKCGCVLFHVPRDEGSPVCNYRNFMCVYDTLEDLRYSMSLVCRHCLPLCEDITYRFQVTSAAISNESSLEALSYEDWRRQFSRKRNHSSPVYKSVSVAHIFFGSTSVVPKLRKRLYGTTDLIANTGGIFGLCLGFSALSAVEVVYFALVRALWNCYQTRRKYGFCKKKTKNNRVPLQQGWQQRVEAAPIFHFPASFIEAERNISRPEPL